MGQQYEVTTQDPSVEKKNPEEEEEEDVLKNMIPYSSLFRYSTGLDFILMVVGTIGAAVNGAAMPGFALIFGELLDNITGSTDEVVERVSSVSILFAWLAFAVFVAGIFQVGCWTLVAERQANTIRVEYFKAILRQDVGWFDVSDPGQLSTRISGDTNTIQEGMGEKMGHYIQHMSMFIAGFVIAFIEGPELTGVLCATVPALGISGYFITRAMTSMATKGQEAYAKAGSIAEEIISSMRTVASFGGESRAAAQYEEKLEGAEAAGIHRGLVGGVGVGTTMFVMFCSYALAFWYGSRQIYDGRRNGGDVVTVFFSVLIGAMAIGQASPDVGYFAKARAAAYKVFQTIDAVPTIQTGSASSNKRTFKGDIRFQTVSFKYPSRPDTIVFDGVDFEIKQGQTVALVGQSGSGKSTVIQLLERFYDPERGTVSIDGTDIKKMPVDDLRGGISLVSQEPVLFATSIEENIRYGKPDATKDQIIEATKMANAYDFIQRLENGFDTFVGERGTQLSGGQKQRIAIARAIVSNPSILLLDEATSALDAESEGVVQQALDNVMQGRTTIIVAHRLSTIKNADNILVFKQGTIVEEGNHKDLVAKNGVYADLVQRQMAGTSDDDEQEVFDLRKRSSSHTRGHGDSNADEATSSDADKKEEKELYAVPLSRLWKLNNPEMMMIVLGIFSSALYGSVMPMFALIFTEVIEVFYLPDKEEMIRQADLWCIGFVALAVFTFLTAFGQQYCFGFSGEKLTRRIRSMSFDAIIHQDMEFFDDEENSTGALATRLSTEATLISGMTGINVAIALQNVVSLVVGLALAFNAGPKLAGVVLAVVPAIMLAGAGQMYFLQGFAAQGNVAYREAGQVVTEAVMGIRTVLSLRAEAKIGDMYATKLIGPQKLGAKKGLAGGVGFGASNMVMFGAYGLAFWYGSVLIKDGEMNFGDVLQVFFAIVMAAMGAGQASTFAPDMGKAKAATSAVFSIIDREVTVDSRSTGGKAVQSVEGEIEFVDVSFTYPSRPDTQIFDKMSLTVKKGQTVALVGSSGSGKSTIIQLLQRFYEPDSGKILLDGVDLREWNVACLRERMGLVQQEPVLFNTTIYENIRYGREDANRQEIEGAAARANAAEFISRQNQGYETGCGERGGKLSGGQKQRVAIARAILKNPNILLLDEATSALDAESERLVQDALDEIMVGRTTIVVAHRLSTIKDADKIVVFDKGAIVETGTHTELMTRNGAYAKLVANQIAH
eukprot:GFYU01001804.1.p1 GENE.GFYU01001804.1~~GFYU01001804.1.p1  ORF type:complete len:1235 (+),score=430.50 GFYU01001804.1:168-3872(+)